MIFLTLKRAGVSETVLGPNHGSATYYLDVSPGLPAGHHIYEMGIIPFILKSCLWGLNEIKHRKRSVHVQYRVSICSPAGTVSSNTTSGSGGEVVFYRSRENERLSDHLSTSNTRLPGFKHPLHWCCDYFGHVRTGGQAPKTQDKTDCGKHWQKHGRNTLPSFLQELALPCLRALRTLGHSHGIDTWMPQPAIHFQRKKCQVFQSEQ